MAEIIEEWLSENNNTDTTLNVRMDLGCHDSETDFNFALFAASALEKRFHYLTFFVAVYRVNMKLVRFTKEKTLVNHLFRVKLHNMSYFTFQRNHSIRLQNRAVFRKHESIMVVVVYMERNQTTDVNCLSQIKLNCRQWWKTTDQTVRNGFTFFAQQHRYLCGNSRAIFPYSVKFCHSDDRPLLIGVCH